ncbi:hypothetical protein HHI36_001615 [Cryptolaemus montrouzieri]|uniref:Uncharacterized protein n=1 Tax=Cryptolaemus montrouzieri TaxID=559131 RepID=A0ABD2P9F9_9CUCU
MPNTYGRREPINSSTQDDETLEKRDVDNISEPYEDFSEDYVPTNSEDPSSNDEYIERENMEVSTDEEKRKMKPNKSSWNRTVVKNQRIRGKKYVNRSENLVQEKIPSASNCGNSRNITEEQRRFLYHEY